LLELISEKKTLQQEVVGTRKLSKQQTTHFTQQTADVAKTIEAITRPSKKTLL